MSLDEKALAKRIQEQIDELHEIGDALFTTNALRGRRIHQIAKNLESLVNILNEKVDGI
jgi:hypothetical protein